MGRPYGWAPHQILIGKGLQRYGYADEAAEAAFAWLKMLVRATVEYNGLITEKFNVQKASHKVDAEYGNVGAAFEICARRRLRLDRTLRFCSASII